MWNMMCDVMPTISEDSISQRSSQFSGEDANFEQLMVSMLDERDKLVESLRETQERLGDSELRLKEVEKERDSLHRQIAANLPQGKHATNMKNHLSAKHREEYQTVTDLNVEKSSQNDTQTTQGGTPPIIEKIKKLCVQLVTVHGRPLAMMEDEAFQELINLASRKVDGHTHVNVKAIKNEITREARDIKNKISNEVNHSLLSLKLDAATCLDRRFIGINIQYIKDCQIMVRNLTVLEVNERQTGEFLKSALVDVLAEFRISPEQIYCICTDNGSNMKKMVELVGGEYCSPDEDLEKSVELNDDEDADYGEDQDMDEIFVLDVVTSKDIIESESSFRARGMLCAAHTLQLAIKDANDENPAAQATILMTKRVVNILRRPNVLNLIQQAKLKKPIKDCATRWTATYNMMVRLVELQEFCNTLPEISSLVSDDFWCEIKALIECYRPANEATIALQKQQLTIGDFFITWLKCKTKVASIQHDFAIALHRAMEYREAKLLQNDVVLECLYLDPRLNVVLSETQCQKARNLLKEVHQQMTHLNTLNSISEEDTESVSLINDEPSRAIANSDDLAAIENILLNTERVRGNRRHSRSFDACLYEIVTISRLNLTENIISYWNNKSVITSDIAQVANIVLAAPATQVSVERLFSSLKFILNPLRSNLSKHFLNDLMLIRSNKDLLN